MSFTETDEERWNLNSSTLSLNKIKVIEQNLFHKYIFSPTEASPASPINHSVTRASQSLLWPREGSATKSTTGASPSGQGRTWVGGRERGTLKLTFGTGKLHAGNAWAPENHREEELEPPLAGGGAGPDPRVTPSPPTHNLTTTKS